MRVAKLAPHASKDRSRAWAAGAAMLALPLATPALARSSEAEPAGGSGNSIAITVGPSATTAIPVGSAAALDGTMLAPAASLPPEVPHPEKIKARVVASQFVGMPVAGDTADTLRYSGRVDGYFDIRGDAFGIDESVTLTIRPEYTWGKDSNGLIGLIPNNTALFRGEGKDDFDLSLSVTKRWNSGPARCVN